jgi:putative nucleotidyltransferase with HDIG domain
LENKPQNTNNKGILRFVTENSVKIAIGLITLILISLMLPSYKSIDTEYEVGTVWSSEDLIAPFSFPIYRDDKEYDAEKNEVAKNLAPVYNKINNQGNIQAALDSLFLKFEQVLTAAKNLEANNDGDILSPALQEMKSGITVDLSNEEWQNLYTLYKDPNTYQAYKNSIINTLTELGNRDLIETDKSKIASGRISIETPDNRTQDIKDLNGIYDEKEIRNIVRQKVKGITPNEELALTGEEIAKVYLQPNLIFNKDLTDVELNNRIERIPKTIGIVRENERIISKHDPITRQTKLKLDSYKTIRLERIGVQDYFRQYIGKFFTVLILLIIYCLFLNFIRPKIFKDNLRLTLISSLILLECFFAFISLKITASAPVELLIFISVASIMLTILFDSRLSFFTTVIICFLVSAIRGGDYTIAFISFCASVLAIFSVRDIKNRSQIFRSFFFILIGYSFSILAIGFDRTEATDKVLMELLFGGINAVMSPVIAYGLLIFYEKVFNITTDLTLVELSDFNHPLLKELSSKAPGTFHHSIIMGNLSEEAAHSINANRILARVGCYYHDIGKTVEPEFFIENQIDKINKHDDLNPTTSAKIIIAHVNQGMELARKYKLPEVLIDFIPMHHGTTLVSYFYKKAQDQENIFPEGSKEEYRYPGPKPQTKETGIVMLADSIEAATRTLDDPTTEKLEKKIIEIIRTRFMEGELDECELTLRDLTKIKNSFLKILIGIHHHRIKYPDKKVEALPESIE